MTARKKKNEIKDEDIGFEFEDGTNPEMGEVLEINMESEDEDIETEESREETDTDIDTESSDTEKKSEDADTDDESDDEEDSENDDTETDVEITVTAEEDESEEEPTDTEPTEQAEESDTDETVTEDKESDDESETDAESDESADTENSPDSNNNESDDNISEDKNADAEACADDKGADPDAESEPTDTDENADKEIESEKADETATDESDGKKKSKLDIKVFKDKTVAILTVFGKKAVSVTKKVTSKAKSKIKTKITETKQKRKESKLDDDGNPKPKEKFGVKWHRYWFGDDTHKVKPSSFKGVLGRFYLKSFCGYVDLYSRMYDKDIDEIRQDIELVKKSKLPKEAVKLKGFKRTWDIDMDLPIRYFDLAKDDGFTASSYFNYAKNNVLNDSMYMDSEEQAKTPTNKRMLIAVVGILCFGVIIVYMYAMGMI